MDMAFNVAQLMKEPVGAKRTYEFGTPDLVLSEPLEGDNGTLTARDVRGNIGFTHLRAQIRAVGDVRAEVELQCSRCLEPFVQHVSAKLDELFRQTIDVVGGYPVKTDEGETDEEGFTIDHNHILDLTEPVRQALLVALPMQPLHSEDCRGLCPTCGANLNIAECDCPTEEIDPRFADLSRLLADADLGEGAP
ncbi:MAG: YceD family protein [Chloroflexia bacterium]